MDPILMRIAALETAVGKLQIAMAGIQNALEMAQNHPVSCAVCGEDPEKKEVCEEEFCPCGR